MKTSRDISLTICSDSNVRVDYGVTFAGVLYYRGFVLESIRPQKPVHEWPAQAILSTFISGIDPHRSFSRFFRETRARLLYYVCEGINKQSTGLQTAYILACMEYAKVNTVCDPNTPTEHMLLFAKFFQTESANYLQDNKQNQRMRKQLPQYLSHARNSAEWAETDTVTEAICDFLFPGGAEDIKKAAEEQQKKRRNKTRGTKNRTKNKDEKAGAYMEEALGQPSFTVSKSRIATVILKKPLLQALVAPMPGLQWTNKDIVEVEPVNIGDFTRLTDEMARMDFDNEVVESVEDREYEVADITRAFDVVQLKQTRGGVALESDDQVFFEEGLGQFNLQDFIDEDEEMDM